MVDETRVVEEVTGEQGHEESMRLLVVDEVMGSGRFYGWQGIG